MSLGDYQAINECLGSILDPSNERKFSKHFLNHLQLSLTSSSQLSLKTLKSTAVQLQNHLGGRQEENHFEGHQSKQYLTAEIQAAKPECNVGAMQIGSDITDF